MASPNTKRKVSKMYTDLFNTPPEALEALLAHEEVWLDPKKLYFEPCNGIGEISNWLKKNQGIKMVTNELHPHGESDYKEDFLLPNPLASESWNFDVIVSNPPYKIAKEFILEGFKYATEQYQLLRLNFLEGIARKEELYSMKHLKRVFIFSGRISCTKGVDKEPQANAVAYCWLHFDNTYRGQPTLHWL